MAYKVNGTEFSSTANGQNFANVTVTDGAFEVKGDFELQSVQGSNFGYTAGGWDPPPAITFYNTIDRFPFASDTNASDVGDLTNQGAYSAGASSATNGYISGGSIYAPTSPTLNLAVNTIQKFPFAASGNATDVGDLPQTAQLVNANNSFVAGYNSGGLIVNPNADSNSSNAIRKFPFSTDANGLIVGSLTASKRASASLSSSEHGYVAGGRPGPTSPGINVIERFPFATDGVSADVGDLSTALREDASGVHSSTNGYVAGGINTSNIEINSIQKFPLASTTTTSIIGGLSRTNAGGLGTSGNSSNENGYINGGHIDPPENVSVNNIEKFPFSVDTGSSDVGDLTVGRSNAASNNY